MLDAQKHSHLRSAAKAISWRVVGTLDTFILSYIVTGDVATAGAIASLETATKTFLYYVHERAWLMNWRKPRALATAKG